MTLPLEQIGRRVTLWTMSVAEEYAGLPHTTSTTPTDHADQAGFERWYGDVWPRLVSFVRVQAGGDTADAADVAAEAMARLYARWDAGTVRDPVAWVYGVSLNLLRRRARRRAMEHRLLFWLRARSAAVDTPVPDVDLVDAIDALPPRQRTAIHLRYVADLTQAQVAQALGIAPGSAASLLHAARANLERRLAAPTGGGDDARPR